MYHILVVDDEEKIRTLIRKYAEFEGHQVTEAENGMQAVEICRRTPSLFDIIIMDVMMPELDGFSAVAEIRKTCASPVLMLSARGEEYDKIHGFELGVDDYVVKPFSPKELMMRVTAIMNRVHPQNAVPKYLDNKPLWEIDYDWSGFSWISNDDNKNSVIVFRRIASNGDELIAVCNFLPTEHEQYSFGVPYYADYKEVFTTDDKKFGGDSDGNASYTAQCEGMHGLEYSITMKIPAMSAVFLKPVNKRSPESDKPKPEKAEKPAKTAEKKAETQVQKTVQKTAAKSGASAKKPAAKKTNTANRKKNGKAKK